MRSAHDTSICFHLSWLTVPGGHSEKESPLKTMGLPDESDFHAVNRNGNHENYRTYFSTFSILQYREKN